MSTTDHTSPLLEDGRPVDAFTLRRHRKALEEAGWTLGTEAPGVAIPPREAPPAAPDDTPDQAEVGEDAP